MKPMKNRMTVLLGVEYPIIQAPMGWIARAQLASAVSNAGGLGIIETSSGELDEVRAEIIKMLEPELKDENEQYRKILMETVEKIVSNQGVADINAKLEEKLMDGILFCF